MRQRATEALDQVMRRMGLRDGPASADAPTDWSATAAPLDWHVQPMVPRVDMRDKDAVIAAMEG